MLDLFRQPAPDLPARQSIWTSAPAAWLYSVATTLLIGWAAYKAFTLSMLWVAIIQLALTLIPLIIMALALRSREYDKVLQRVMTVLIVSNCLDLLGLR